MNQKLYVYLAIFCFVIFAFFEEIEFSANAKVLMKVSPSFAAMQKFHACCIHSRFLVPCFYMAS